MLDIFLINALVLILTMKETVLFVKQIDKHQRVHNDHEEKE